MWSQLIQSNIGLFGITITSFFAFFHPKSGVYLRVGLWVMPDLWGPNFILDVGLSWDVSLRTIVDFPKNKVCPPPLEHFINMPQPWMVYCLISFLIYMLASISAQINGGKNPFLYRTGFNQLHISLLPLFSLHEEYDISYAHFTWRAAPIKCFARYFLKNPIVLATNTPFSSM